MIQRKDPDVDIINNVLKAALQAFPDSVFIQSLSKQYHERGGLSKKQLEGLYQKSKKIKDIPVNWMATIEAEILKRPTRYKATLPENKPLYTKDESAGQKISAILTKYPQHKRVLFLKLKYDNNETLSANELTELEKFHKLLK